LDHGDEEHQWFPAAGRASGDRLESLRDLYAAMQPHDADEIRQALAHDIEIQLPDALPWGGTFHGHEGVQAMSEIFDDYVEGTWADPDELFDAGDRTVVLGRMRGRARSSGVAFEVPFAHVWGLSDGVPSSFRALFDTAPITEALRGMGPADRSP
jgi:ketosteroid isomerase-like protein